MADSVFLTDAEVADVTKWLKRIDGKLYAGDELRLRQHLSRLLRDREARNQLLRDIRRADKNDWIPEWLRKEIATALGEADHE